MTSGSVSPQFLAARVALPAIASAPPASNSAGPQLQYKALGKNGPRVTTVGFGTMITSDPNVIARNVAQSGRE
jgi:hypothetical protein